MSKSNAWENALLLLVFNNTDITNFGDASGLVGSSTAGNLYVSLHTANPDEAGDQTTSECSYTDYARVAVARSGSGWTVTNNSVSPAADVTFPVYGGSGADTATHVGIGTASSGTGRLLYKGALSASIAIDTGITPVWGSGSTITED